MKSGIYKIVNLVNGKLYIGSAVDLAARWRQHSSKLRNGNHHSIKLQRSWDKHGAESFGFEVVEYAPADSDLVKREQVWIDALRPFYNIAPVAGSQLGVKLSATTRGKMSAARIGKSPSADTRAKMSAWQVGKVVSEETRRKISNTKVESGVHRGQQPWNLGKKHSPETKAKMSAARRGRPSRPGHMEMMRSASNAARAALVREAPETVAARRAPEVK